MIAPYVLPYDNVLAPNMGALSSLPNRLTRNLQSKHVDLKILIVEDEVTLNQTMVEFLTAAGFLCETVFTYKAALEKIDYFTYDCIVLDIMLPDGSGLDIVRLLKQDKKADGIIIVSAKGALEDKIEGLELGADDYLIKPFHLSELSVRIASVIRRKNFHGQPVLGAGDIKIDTGSRHVTINEQTVELTQKEYQLLLFFVVNRNRVLSKNAIAQHLWGDDMDFPDNYDFIYSHMKNIRKKIVAAGGIDPFKSIYGEGYKMQLL